MPTEILMPALSPTMTEGKLSKWLVKEGDDVRAGDLIAEIETDKATMEVEAVDEGKVGKIVIAEGTDAVSVNSVIAVLVGDGETVSENLKLGSQLNLKKLFNRLLHHPTPQQACRRQRASEWMLRRRKLTLVLTR